MLIMAKVCVEALEIQSRTFVDDHLIVTISYPKGILPRLNLLGDDLFSSISSLLPEERLDAVGQCDYCSQRAPGIAMSCLTECHFFCYDCVDPGLSVITTDVLRMYMTVFDPTLSHAMLCHFTASALIS